MSVRKRRWKTTRGEDREAWVVDYVDQQGARVLKTFERKKEADTFASTAAVEVREGTHVPDSASITVDAAGELWLASAEKAGLERTTLDQYRQHLRLHIKPFLGRTLLSKLSVPAVRAFEDKLHAEGRSPTLARYVVRSLGALLADAQERGLVVRNSVRELRARRRKGKDGRKDSRGAKLKIGVDIPTPAEARKFVEALNGNPFRPLLITAIFAGLRASELRGLRWSDIDLKKGKLDVHQRADRYRAIGKPKTESSERTLPLFPIVANTLKEWRLACPKGKLDLAFPNGEGNVEFHVNIIERGLKPAMIAAEVTEPMRDAKGEPMRDEDGKPLVRAKYTGLHALRHFYASLCINRKIDGGLELPPKVVQHRLGHSSITVTLDTYGHLFPQGDDGAELADAERALLG